MNDDQFKKHLGPKSSKVQDDVLTYNTAAGTASVCTDIDALVDQMEEGAKELHKKLVDFGWVFVGTIEHETMELIEPEQAVAVAPPAKPWHEDTGAASSSSSGAAAGCSSA